MYQQFVHRNEVSEVKDCTVRKDIYSKIFVIF